MRTGTGRLLGYAGIAAVVIGAVVALAATTTPSSRLVTNTTSGKNQNPNIDKKGRLIVFTSNTNHVSGVMDSATGAFDFDHMGNNFTPPAATHPNPLCINCDHDDDTVGDLYLWRLKASGSAPANSFLQLTFSSGGGFEANQLPDISQNGSTVAWASDQNHTGGNADGNREIFFANLTGCNFSTPSGTPPCPITQVTTSTGGTNETVNLDDTGTLLVFGSNRDYNGVPGCFLVDGVTACDNSDGNFEIMLYDRGTPKLTQITKTTGGGGAANIRPRISNEGRFIAFQSTRDFSGTLPAGVTCTLPDGTSACGNSDGNGEIMLFDRGAVSVPPKFTQITNTPSTGNCSGPNPNERVEISKNGTYITFQSRCEAQLNPSGCGSCDGNDEAFLFSAKTKAFTQVTISDNNYNHVPRISGKGGWIIFESKCNYRNLNSGHARTLFIIKRSTKAGSAGMTGPGQVVDDSGAGLVQSPKTKLLTPSIFGGFNSSVEQFGVNTTGKYFTFDNKKSVGNQEVWFLNRSK